jgi:N6-L-threonylcarbamoyladenine synthase
MQSKDLVLGIDTSNYTTSLSITDINGAIIADLRKLLTVKQGERGLRQSHALFQHMENLPDMLLELFEKTDKNRIGAVAASNRPRPVEGSYMPVFKTGANYGKVMAASLGVPFFEFSHQEGHLEAVRHNSSLSEQAEYLAYHLSGGTCELLHVKNNTIQILGGSKDLSFGQVIDRIGVALGMEFPAGKEMDMIAVKMRDKLLAGSSQEEKSVRPANLLKKIPIDGLDINLSGMETQCRRELEKGEDPETMIYELFLNMSSCLCRLTDKVISETGCDRVLFTGGVTASRFVRDEIDAYFSAKPFKIVFGAPALSSDNAVGISFLGGKELWQ